MTRLLFLRHGPTEWNRQKRLQGRTDVALNPAGREEVRGWTVPTPYRSWRWVSSPLSRAFETAKLLGMEPQTDPALIEMSWGDWEGEVWHDLLAADDPALDANRARGLDFCPPGGESPRAVQTRLKPWLAGLREPTVAVSHKGVLQALYGLATDWQMTTKQPVKFNRSAAHLFEVGPETCEVVKMNIDLKATE